MKNKGFTLLELIVAIAILLSGITAFGLASSVSIRAHKANQVKIENVNYADTIINIFKANGKLLLKNIHDNQIGNSDFTYYIYFDNLTLLENALKINPPLNALADGTYANCLGNNVNNRSNGAYVNISQIYNISEPGSGTTAIINDGNINTNNNVNFYSVVIKVWNFQYGASSEVKFKIFVGR